MEPFKACWLCPQMHLALDWLVVPFVLMLYLFISISWKVVVHSSVLPTATEQGKVRECALEKSWLTPLGWWSLGWELDEASMETQALYLSLLSESKTKNVKHRSPHYNYFLWEILVEFFYIRKQLGEKKWKLWDEKEPTKEMFYKTISIVPDSLWKKETHNSVLFLDPVHHLSYA